VGLRVGLGQTNSFVCLWEILTCYISLKFQDKYTFLKFWKFRHEWCVQRTKGLSKNRFKIETSIKFFGYSVKFNVPIKKSMGFAGMSFFRRGWTWKKSGTRRWLIVQQTKGLSSPKAVSDDIVRWKVIFSCPGVWLGNVCLLKTKGVSRRYILARTSSEWGWVRQFSRKLAAALTIHPTAPELHIGELKVLSSEHFIGNLNSTPPPPYSYCQGNDFSGPTTWLPWLMGPFNVAKERARVDIWSKYSAKYSFTLVKNKDFLQGRSPCFSASYSVKQLPVLGPLICCTYVVSCVWFFVLIFFQCCLSGDHLTSASIFFKRLSFQPLFWFAWFVHS